MPRRRQTCKGKTCASSCLQSHCLAVFSNFHHGLPWLDNKFLYLFKWMPASLWCFRFSVKWTGLPTHPCICLHLAFLWSQSFLGSQHHQGLQTQAAHWSELPCFGKSRKWGASWSLYLPLLPEVDPFSCLLVQAQASWPTAYSLGTRDLF